MECVKCKEKGLNINDFYTHGSWCQDCYSSYSKERYNKITSGKVRKSRIKVFRDLPILEKIDLITNFEIKDISKQFNVSPSQISLELSRSNLFEVKNENKTRKVNRNVIAKLPDTTKEDEIYSLNSWKNSIERHCFVNAGLMKNKSLKYI